MFLALIFAELPFAASGREAGDTEGWKPQICPKPLTRSIYFNGLLSAGGRGEFNSFAERRIWISKSYRGCGSCSNLSSSELKGWRSWFACKPSPFFSVKIKSSFQHCVASGAMVLAVMSPHLAGDGSQHRELFGCDLFPWALFGFSTRYASLSPGSPCEIKTDTKICLSLWEINPDTTLVWAKPLFAEEKTLRWGFPAASNPHYKDFVPIFAQL